MSYRDLYPQPNRMLALRENTLLNHPLLRKDYSIGVNGKRKRRTGT
jgi:hypothetical protein